jgi:hypothetical protein
MAVQLSPGVNITEIDLTTIVPAVSTSTGAIAGVFRWGPVLSRTLLGSETDLVNTFGKPTSLNPETFFTAANFLGYGSSLYVVRAANTTDATVGTMTAIANTAALTATLPAQVIRNSNDYDLRDANNTVSSTFDTKVNFVAKYPGAIGNSLQISVCDSVNAFSSNVNLLSANSVGNNMVGTLTLLVGSNTANIVFTSDAGTAPGNTAANAFANSVASSFVVGDLFVAGNSAIGTQSLVITSVASPVATGNNGIVTLSFASPYRLSTNYVLSGNTPALPITLIANSVTVNTTFISTSGISGGSLSNGDVVFIANGTGTALFSAAPNNAVYYVVNANTTALQLSATFGGTNLAFTAGGGTNTTFIFGKTYAPRKWQYASSFNGAPVTSNFVSKFGNSAAMDSMHVVVTDNGGLFTGVPGTILEAYPNISRASDSKSNDGASIYYKTVLNTSSRYVWWANDRTGAVSNTSTNIVNSTNVTPLTLNFNSGQDGNSSFSETNVQFSVLASGYDLFNSSTTSDISLILQGKPLGATASVNGYTVSNFQLANYITQNIAEIRKDCVAFISPDDAIVRSNVGAESTVLNAWRGALSDSSYAVVDSGYKYMYDRYNDVYRYVPLNGDIAGLCARTDLTNDAWWSPAGFNRGQIKNIVKLRFNPTKTQRDDLYQNSINPVATFPGQGTILDGDKTLTSKPSAFDRINVRRLFITLEKAIGKIANYSLFEFNDDFTRTQFKNLINPYLRQVQSRRGITDFLVVCDTTNNTGQVIDSNQFVGDIYIKPNRSINFIQLNFVAVRTGVAFSTIIGQ